VNAALGAILVHVGFCAAGLAVSLGMDRDRPPRAGQRLVARRRSGALGKRLPLIGFNVAMVGVLFPGSVWLLDERFPLTVPSPAVFLVQLTIIFAGDDFGFYWAHRAMHHYGWLYRRVHRTHHEAFAPVPIEFIYAHPLDVLLGGVGTALGLSAALLAFGQISAWTLWGAVAVRMAHELCIHSGLRGIPFSRSAERHARHHASPTRGNYASTFTLWDRLLCTESEPENPAGAPR
jgi:sterol desaturase/sphingolipid hydroxylase (fatty acid hydroxylase superfamily)